MDSSRASSIYSTDSSKKPSYLDSRPSLEPSSRANSFKAARDYAESLSPAPSRPSPSTPAQAPAPAPAPAPITARSSPKPSFMNYRDEREQKSSPIAIPERSAARKPVPTSTPAAPMTTRDQGILLLAIVAELHPRTMHYLGICLRKQRYSGITIVGSKAQEDAIKELKMEVYGVIGQLRQELIVSTHVLDEWNEESLMAIMRKPSGDAEPICSVLCTPAYEQANSSASDILSLDREELCESWSRSVGFLHAIAKATMPHMVEGRRGSQGSNVFLVMAAQARSPSGFLNQNACNTLVSQLHEGYSGRELAVGHAEEVLLPELAPVQTNGADPMSVESYAADESIFTPSESPTKLWNMWSLQNELGG